MTSSARMGRLFAVALLLWLPCGICGAVDTIWNDFTGSSPYSANTLSSIFSSATDTDTGGVGTSPADPNDPSGNFIEHFHSNANLTFTLTPSVAVPVSLSTLDFDVNNVSANTLSFTYSVAGGGSGNLSTFNVTGDTGTWTPVSMNLSSIVDTNGGVITITGNTDSGATRLANFDLAATSAAPEPGIFALALLGGAGMLVRRRRPHKNPL